MYLLPTSKELTRLWSEIDPKEKFLRAARQAINEACQLDSDSMAAFYLDSQDIDVFEDEIHILPPKYLEHCRDTCTVNFRGWTFERTDEYAGIDLGEKVSWDEI